MPQELLTFPWDDAPKEAEIKQVADGVFWLRMPLPIALDHINLYLLEDDDGWVVIDTGMKTPAIKDLWLKIFKKYFHDKPVKQVVCTHMHPDHVGLAGWMCDYWKAPLYMSALEYLSARIYSTPKSKDDGLAWNTQNFFKQLGLGDDYLEYIQKQMFGFSSIVSNMPTSFVRLVEGEQPLILGGKEWQLLTASGHSPEHACLYCKELGVLLAGDQIIAGITPNVSVMTTEPEANPLKSWLAALPKFKELPKNTLVLPAHKLPFYGLHSRVDSVLDHHEKQLLRLELACKEKPSTAHQLLSTMFKRTLTFDVMSLAIGECLSHLHLLIDRGYIKRELQEGVYFYYSISETLQERITATADIDLNSSDDESVMV